MTKALHTRIQKYTRHLPDCRWHKDWHDCTCGLHALLNEIQSLEYSHPKEEAHDHHDHLDD